MIIIDNGFRKRGAADMCNCVLAGRVGRKTELGSRGTRSYDKPLQKSIGAVSPKHSLRFILRFYIKYTAS